MTCPFTEKLFLDNYWTTQDLCGHRRALRQQCGPAERGPRRPRRTARGQHRLPVRAGEEQGHRGIGPGHAQGLPLGSDHRPRLAERLDAALPPPLRLWPTSPPAGAYVFGPFPWTPTHVGNTSASSRIAENAADLSRHRRPCRRLALVSHANLVPFDNNIAQRNLYPTAAKGSMTKSFWVSNPTFERATVQLHFDSTLPEGWTFHTQSRPALEAIHLAPRERRWVEVTIDAGRRRRDRSIVRVSRRRCTISADDWREADRRDELLRRPAVRVPASSAVAGHDESPLRIGHRSVSRDSVARPVRRRRARAETAVPEPGLLRPRGTAMTRCWSTPTCSAWPRCRPRPGTCVSSRGASWPACISTASSGSGKRPRKELGEYSVARSMRLRIEHYVEGRAGPYLG